MDSKENGKEAGDSPQRRRERRGIDSEEERNII
jgi:hypothetical protein